MTSAGKTGSCFPDERAVRALQCVFRIPLPHVGKCHLPLCGAPVSDCRKQKEDFLCTHIPFPLSIGGRPPER